jgi:hypothetical protein
LGYADPLFFIASKERISFLLGLNQLSLDSSSKLEYGALFKNITGHWLAKLCREA